MTKTSQDTITCRSDLLDYREAAEIAIALMAGNLDSVMCIDLSATDSATTAAFAALIDLRVQLRRRGGDFVLHGLRARTAALYCLLRLQSILPAA